MPQVSLDAQASLQPSGNGFGPEVGHAMTPTARPRVVLLESGVKALVEVLGLADVDSRVDAVLLSAEQIDSPDLLIGGSNRVDVEGVLGAGGTLPDKL